MPIRFLLIVSMLLLGGCASSHSAGPWSNRSGSLDDLAGMMTGWFDSADQAAADPDNYFNIRLVMTPIWEDRTDGVWLYVEQAASSALARPYRQRVYHVHRVDETLRSDVYTLPGEALDYAGAYMDVARFDGITPEDLELAEPTHYCKDLLQRFGFHLHQYPN